MTDFEHMTENKIVTASIVNQHKDRLTNATTTSAEIS